jgi:hypothetical protein
MHVEEVLFYYRRLLSEIFFSDQYQPSGVELVRNGRIGDGPISIFLNPLHLLYVSHPLFRFWQYPQKSGRLS